MGSNGDPIHSRGIGSRPDTHADAAEFLLGQRATFITGADLLVDGGVVASLLRGHHG
ncbi:NAD(P)-dependent dehydrogenase (short-subunit alcohol dehydrogenase family) [Saccharomonospora amisosensis]|uniref:NAD(P)-dependent dehydrogenase (Short-subunit alcohol dehydrogenase family) n=1 Tax=Saccharomonospora amisosensis TaxID=1128677 RepID=A0A7X5URM3_9PSEU|nr:hypothetical protein [Saccharomonospora amisosensis]NIJ12934.1 NAD(P)-dependent dehydrogenase (short-subunit alcohol dehydrogenase family) [Saccharomonospora amisosensis]